MQFYFQQSFWLFLFCLAVRILPQKHHQAPIIQARSTFLQKQFQQVRQLGTRLLLRIQSRLTMNRKHSRAVLALVIVLGTKLAMIGRKKKA